MKMRYRFRFYPTKKQEATLARTFGCCRYVYNWALNLRTEAWATRKERINYAKTCSLLTTFKKSKDTRWLSEVSSTALQQALRHLQSAFLNFWNKTSKYPTFKKKRNKQSAEYTRSAFRYEPLNRNLVVSGLGRLDVHWSREFSSYPTTATITKEPSGGYYVTLVLDEQIEQLPKTGNCVGVDLGVSRLATLSNGERVPNPRYLGENLAKLAKIQRNLSRKVKGSHRWGKTRLRVARLHAHIANSREDCLHKLTTNLVCRFDRIAIEDLNVRGMTANHKIARAISDVGMGIFRRFVTYKCDWYGKELILVDRFYPSSKTCSNCGHIVESLPLGIREWDCPKCQAHHDRDENAAKNIASAEGHSVTARGENVRQLRASAPRCNSRRSANQLDVVRSAPHE